MLVSKGDLITNFQHAAWAGSMHVFMLRLGRRCVSAKRLPLEEHAIYRFSVLSACLCDPADDTIVLDQLPDHSPGQYPLWAMRHVHIERLRMACRRKAKVRASTSKTRGQALRRTNRRG